jgi:DNA-binding MarR family transcriptional regulator
MNEASAIYIEHFRAALRWRRRIERDLLRVPLTLTQWLALDALETLHERTGLVLQSHIRRQLELDRATISDVMERLSLRGLVARRPAESNLEWIVLPTIEGKRRAAAGRSLVDSASQIMLSIRVPDPTWRPDEGTGQAAILDS